MGVVRNEDGTGAIVIPGASMDPAQYRFELTYHREQQGLSRGGRTTPERVVVDVPWEAR